MATSSTISGQVTDKSSGAAVSGATVSLVSSGGGGTQTAVTDDQGGYTLSNVADGSYQLTASKDGYEDATGSVTVSNGTASLSPAASADYKASAANTTKDSLSLGLGFTAVEASY
jgi:uncharacterized protein YfaS (alpha-2-macroglobulin family)